MLFLMNNARLGVGFECLGLCEAALRLAKAYAAERLAKYKVPRSIDFEAKLPRLETGKLYKRLLKDRYWGNKDSRIV